jgi:hypothetical protein
MTTFIADQIPTQDEFKALAEGYYIQTVERKDKMMWFSSAYQINLFLLPYFLQYITSQGKQFKITHNNQQIAVEIL